MVLFCLLALFLNDPHCMATVYRAYHTRTELAKYRILTVHVTTLLAALAAAAHVWTPRRSTEAILAEGAHATRPPL